MAEKERWNQDFLDAHCPYIKFFAHFKKSESLPTLIFRLPKLKISLSQHSV